MVRDERAAADGAELVAVVPEPVRPLHLHVVERPPGLPELDPGGPAQGDPVQVKPILDQRAGAHLRRLWRSQAEPEPRRRDALEVARTGEEGEHLVDRARYELLAVEVVDPWVIVEHHVD